MLTNEQLDQLENLAKLFYTVSECAVILEVDKKNLGILIQDDDTKESKRYHKGLLESEKEVREKVIEMALRGSTKAQAQAIEFIKQAKLENNEDIG